MAVEGTIAENGSWTNASVLLLAGAKDPLRVATELAGTIISEAAAAGLEGPPFDPFALAELLGLSLRARADIADARITADTVGVRSTPRAPLDRFVSAARPLAIEYNPTRPRGRLRYNVAHEIAHALFPDVADVVRHRMGTGAVPGYGDGDTWQLELLCNVVAAELLMPGQAVAGLVDIDPDIDFIMEHRRRFDVSTEALLRRLATATSRSLALIAASRRHDRVDSLLTVEYVVESKSFAPSVHRRAIVPSTGALGECVAVGQTARGIETIDGTRLRVQAVGVSPYPGNSLPRVLALVEPDAPVSDNPSGLGYRSGDISDVPVGDGPLVIAHVVNDSARVWGRRGVAAALASHFPTAARAFQSWAVAAPSNLALGNVHTVEVEVARRPVTIASMVAQRGYGPGVSTRLDYQALQAALARVAKVAQTRGAEVHLPRIGAGQAGGRWDVIAQTIEHTLAEAGLAVVIYTLPQRPREGQR
jgi:O-acetyl-ADP-ribose deacetylase (regulator of RNase III)